MDTPVWLEQAPRAVCSTQEALCLHSPMHGHAAYNDPYNTSQYWRYGPVASSSSVDPQAFGNANLHQKIVSDAYAPSWASGHQTPPVSPAQREALAQPAYVSYPQQSSYSGHRDAYKLSHEAAALSQYRFPPKAHLPFEHLSSGPLASAQYYPPSRFPPTPTASSYSDAWDLSMPENVSPTHSSNNNGWTPQRNPPPRPRSAPLAAPLLYNSPNAPLSSPQSRHKRVRKTTSTRDMKSPSLSPAGKKPAPPAFVNFTAADGNKLLTGVAPSGSSKRKQRELAEGASSQEGDQRSKRRRATGEKQ